MPLSSEGEMIFADCGCLGLIVVIGVAEPGWDSVSDVALIFSQ